MQEVDAKSAEVSNAGNGAEAQLRPARDGQTGKPTLLVVEDDPGLQRQLRWSFDAYEVVTADDRESAINQIRRYEPAVVTMDLGLPPEPDSPDEGFRLLEETLTLAPDTKVIVVTGQHDRSNALKAIGMGAYDFYQKPFDADVIRLMVDRAFRLHNLQVEHRRLSLHQSSSPLAGFITRDPEMLRICRSIEKIAPSSATVLLTGESGTGKEVLARALHELSQYKNGRFVAINCAAIPENLLESELFGHEKGSFTGAVKQTKGKIEYADEGTLFLDEIGDLPSSLQAKLLRFLQERVIERIGGRDEIPVDVRVVCATHQSLRAQIAEGKFREDLYYRLSEIVITIPPLRQRNGDSALLAHALLNRIARAERRQNLSLREDAIAAIETHNWPGNVREMENCIKRAVIMAEGNQVTASDLGLERPGGAPEALNLRQVRDEAERAAVLKVLGRVDGNIARAAELLGISRPTLYDLMKRFGLR